MARRRAAILLSRRNLSPWKRSLRFEDRSNHHNRRGLYFMVMQSRNGLLWRLQICIRRWESVREGFKKMDGEIAASAEEASHYRETRSQRYHKRIGHAGRCNIRTAYGRRSR